MSKSNRHKKQRKQEKAKTQLTGVKKLSKPKNVVEPTLRVKKIIIREQLKSSTLAPLSSLERGTDATSSQISYGDLGLTKWKQSIQDLLASSNHHNVNIRKDAVIGLQEIASSKSPLIIRHLDKLLGKVAALTSDQESIVRRENVKLAAIVISMISDDQLTLFWSMLIAHLKCTMTHLDLAVRHGVLPFIELLVDHHPLLVYESSSVLLPSLLGLISTTSRSNPSDKSTHKQKNVTKLKTEITGKHDDLTVRLKVLRLLSKCLKMSSTKVLDAAKGKALRKKSSSPTQYLSLRYPFGYHCGQSDKEHDDTKFSSGSYADRFYSTISANPYASVFNDDSIKNTINVWYEFVNSCVPVLIETWVEIGPTFVNAADQATNSKGGNKSRKQSGFMQMGNDKDGTNNANVGRRNGLHILNEAHVENMLSIATLLEQLLQSNGISSNFSANNMEEQSQMAKDIKHAQGQNLSKYVFELLPYESLRESRRKDVIAINLKLFLIAGKLKMFDNYLKKKLQLFVEGVISSSKLDENHCKLILEAIRFLDVQKARTLPTNFLISASKMGYHKIITDYLTKFIHPANYDLQRDKNLLDMMTAFQWKEIAIELVNNWPVSNKLKQDEELQHLFELLTFIALRRLTDMNFILRSCLLKLKELVASSEQQAVRESIHRTFVYADADNIFESEFLIPQSIDNFD